MESEKTCQKTQEKNQYMKIETNKIEGYAQMTPEQKLEALESYEFTVDYSDWVKKAQFDKVASDLAKAKRFNEEKMTEDERKEAERLQKEQDLMSKNAELTRKLAIYEFKAKYLAMGFEEALAEETATAQADGDMNKVLANYQVNLENARKQKEKEALENMGSPAKGTQGGLSMTKEQYRALSLEEKNRLALTDPETYKALNQ